MSALNEDPKGVMFVFSLVISLLFVVGGCFYLYSNSHHSLPNASLAVRCEEAGGVLVEGVNDTEGTVSQFAICIPERALYCADIE